MATYKQDFDKDNYERLYFVVKKGQKELIKEKALEMGYKSLSDFCLAAVYGLSGLPRPEDKPKGRIGNKGKDKGGD